MFTAYSRWQTSSDSAAISRFLAANAVNIEAVFQAPRDDTSALPFFITLEAVAQSHVDAALSILAGLEFNVSPPLALPMTPRARLSSPPADGARRGCCVLSIEPRSFEPPGLRGVATSP